MIKAFHREYLNCKIFLEGFDHNRLKHHLIDHDSDVIFTTHDDITDLAEVRQQLVPARTTEATRDDQKEGR
ncbi:hypothetical protein BTJ35_05080 [Lactobacillus delbrueckii subsp. bulgaricus]|nr:hypothetical protein LB080_04640 [Lactobacillus delbrueckii subsp. bulgaricus]MCT3576365.1 hypothetical protein [Lactobacillus delbrueckii]AYC65924.1 hypothetical protein D4Z81_00165 [Lactobacillus delbrueckii subsp. bulgaricus]MBT9088883.1 hypothetical protein [Lactobacillus delbrueckii subsp. bulgaricus]MBT9090473.1 hypothetical protein [Lactobacillus delbrueckii subsp. bulgaricus]